MKKLIGVVSLITIALGVTAYLPSESPSVMEETEVVVSKKSDNSSPAKLETTVSKTSSVVTQQAVPVAESKKALPIVVDHARFSRHDEPLTEHESQAITDITKSLSKAIALNLTSHQFMETVRDAMKLQPKFIDKGTTSVGSRVIVRTHNSLEGTRYIHAQFTGEKNKADFLQHASFQIRPGPDSFSKAVETLNQVLPKNKKIKEASSDYILYNTGDGYVAWVKVANSDDLKSNDYNKSEIKDVGAVIVTIEQDIHSMDEEHNH